MADNFDPEVFDRVMVALAASAAAAALGEDDKVLYFDDELINEQLEDVAVSGGGHFVIPLLIPEEVETGDGRTFKKDSLTYRDLPIPLLWQIQTADGHNGSVVVGRIDHIERIDTSNDTTAFEEVDENGESAPVYGLGNAYGVFDTGPYGREAERLVRGGFLRGISADLDQFEANVNNEESAEAAADDADGDSIKNDKVVVTKGRVIAATLVPKPAFQECFIVMADEPNLTDEDIMLLEDGIYAEDLDDPESLLASIAASAAPVQPPKAWFEDPHLTKPTPITVEDDGRVFGHIATWNTNHIGFNGRQVKPPRSRSNYAYFRTGVLRTQEGSDVSVGQLTLAGGHAPLQADAAAAVKHYDDTASAVADVTAGEDAHGIWVAGSLRPGVTPEQVRVLRASAPSGDWRPIDGRLELVAVCQVNVPGFPVARAMVASGHVTALVAAGASTLAALRDQPINDLEARIEAIERAELAKLKEAATARIVPLKHARQESLVAAAEAARERVMSVRARRSAELSAQAEEARERLFALKIARERVWDEEKHPRDTEGKFRRIVARLGDILSGIDGAEDATRRINSAADMEDSGNAEAADNIAREARAWLDELEDNVTDPATIQRLREAEEVIDATIDDAPEPTRVNRDVVEPDVAPAPDNADVNVDVDAESPIEPVADLLDMEINAEIPPPLARLLSWAVNQLVSAVDPTQAIRNAPNEIRRMLDGKEFQDTQELADWIQELLRRAVSPI